MLRVRKIFLGEKKKYKERQAIAKCLGDNVWGQGQGPHWKSVQANCSALQSPGGFAWKNDLGLPEDEYGRLCGMNWGRNRWKETVKSQGSPAMLGLN